PKARVDPLYSAHVQAAQRGQPLEQREAGARKPVGADSEILQPGKRCQLFESLVVDLGVGEIERFEAGEMAQVFEHAAGYSRAAQVEALEAAPGFQRRDAVVGDKFGKVEV